MLDQADSQTAICIYVEYLVLADWPLWPGQESLIPNVLRCTISGPPDSQQAQRWFGALVLTLADVSAACFAIFLLR